MLASSPKTVLTRERLLAEVWDWADASGTRTVDSHIKALRRKLGADLIRTVHGVGYAFEPPAERTERLDAVDRMSSPRTVRPLRPTCPTCGRSTGSARSRSSSASLVAATVTARGASSPGSGCSYNLGPTRTFPLAIVLSLLLHPGCWPAA